MKKIIYLLAIVGASVLTGCNPLEDINNDIDANENPVVGNDVYTLVSEDYEGLVDQGEDDDVDYYETFEAFSSIDDAEIMLPPFLSNKYPLWGQGSSVLVNFNLYDGNPTEVSSFVNSESYEFVTADYPSADVYAFYPNEIPGETIGGVLLNEITAPEVGAVIRVQYKQFTEEPVNGLAPLVEYVFADSFEDWTTEDESGADAVWTSNTNYVQGNGFFGSTQAPNEEWLVSPPVDLSGETDVKFQITHAIKYATDLSLLKILVATDYTGDILTANWDEITFATPAGVDTLDPSEDYDFSAYDGQTVTIALKYESTDSDAGRWRVGSLALKVGGVEGNTVTLSDFYQFTDAGVWEIMDNVVYLNTADYDLMGEGANQPGQHDNFSSSVLPSDYIPTYLETEYPYAQEEQAIYVIYQYYNNIGVTVTKGNLYTVVDGIWAENTASIQFGFDNGVWVPDNTIKYILATADYSYIASQLITTEGFEAAVANLETHGNFKTGNGASDWSNDMLITAMGILLDNLSPDAEEGQKYLLTFNIYEGGNAEKSLHLIKEDGVWVEVSN